MSALGITVRGVWLNLFVVLGFHVVFTVLTVSQGTELAELPDVFLATTVVLIVPSYLHFLLWRFTIPKRRWFTYALCLLVLIVIWPLVSSGVSKLLIGPEEDVSYVNGLVNTFVAIIFATGLRAIYRSFVRDRELRELRAETAEAQLASLRAQINPHFLFNTLNNIYGVNLDDPSRGSEMLLELAEVMRYHYDLSRQSSVTLGEEVALIASVVELEQLRLRENTCVRLDVSLSRAEAELQIPPLLFVPLVENAFKHGSDTVRAGFICISFTVSDEHIRFEVRNSFFPDKNVVESGVGLANVRARLRLLFGERASLRSERSPEGWLAEISLPIPN